VFVLPPQVNQPLPLVAFALMPDRVLKSTQQGGITTTTLPGPFLEADDITTRGLSRVAVEICAIKKRKDALAIAFVLGTEPGGLLIIKEEAGSVDLAARVIQRRCSAQAYRV